jgi:hypothetical protein
VAPGLYVSACLPNPSGTDLGREWVEITNAGGGEVSLAGWAIADRQGGRHELGGPLGAGATHRAILPQGSPVRLANAGDDIVLLRGDEEVHRVTYQRARAGQIIRFEAPAPPAGQPQPPPALPDADPC